MNGLQNFIELHCILIGIDCGYFSFIKLYPPKHFKSVSRNTFHKPYFKSLIFQQSFKTAPINRNGVDESKNDTF